MLQGLAQPRATALWNAAPPESQPPVNWLHCSQLPPSSGQFMGSQATSRVQFPILVSIGAQSALQPACSTEEGSSPWTPPASAAPPFGPRLGSQGSPGPATWSPARPGRGGPSFRPASLAVLTEVTYGQFEVKPSQCLAPQDGSRNPTSPCNTIHLSGLWVL